MHSAANQYKTFSASFPGFENDESKYIQQVTKQFDLESFTTTPSAARLIEDFEKICYQQEEPFLSSSIFAQYKVFELAKRHNIKVLLDGQGADEILAGYHKYVHWYLQEMISRYKFSGSQEKECSYRKTASTLRWNVKNMLAAFLPSHASIALEKKEYHKIIHHPDVSKNLCTYLKGREWEGIHKPIVTKLNDILYFNTMQNGPRRIITIQRQECHGSWQGSALAFFKCMSWWSSFFRSFKF